MLPNFFIVGAAKAGTTSLYRYLGQHPDICTIQYKEPKYFCDTRNTVARTDSQYEALFNVYDGERAVGEASATYLYDPNVPQRITDLIGEDVKIIISLRNPAARAYSLWGHLYYRNQENLFFEDALEAEEERITFSTVQPSADVNPRYYHYFHSSQYYDQVKSYFSHFGRERVKVYIFEETIKNPQKTMKDIFTFLEVDSNFIPDFEQHNEQRMDRFPLYRKLVTSLRPRWFDKFYESLPMQGQLLIRNAARKIMWMQTKPVQRLKLNEGTKQGFMKRSLPDIYLLEKLLDRDLSLWYRNIPIE